MANQSSSNKGSPSGGQRQEESRRMQPREMSDADRASNRTTTQQSSGMGSGSGSQHSGQGSGGSRQQTGQGTGGSRQQSGQGTSDSHQQSGSSSGSSQLGERSAGQADRSTSGAARDPQGGGKSDR